MYGAPAKVAGLPLCSAKFIANIQLQTAVVNTLPGILFTLTKNKQGNKSILTRFLVENQWSIDLPLINTPRQRIANMTYRTDV